MNEIKIYKNNQIVAVINDVIYVFHYSCGTLSIKDKKGIEHLFVKEDYDLFYIL